jgi:hypothetical protein
VNTIYGTYQEEICGDLALLYHQAEVFYSVRDLFVNRMLTNVGSSLVMKV